MSGIVANNLMKIWNMSRWGKSAQNAHFLVSSRGRSTTTYDWFELGSHSFLFSNISFFTLVGQYGQRHNLLMFRMGLAMNNLWEPLQVSIVLRWSVCHFHQYWFCSACQPTDIGVSVESQQIECYWALYWLHSIQCPLEALFVNSRHGNRQWGWHELSGRFWFVFFIWFLLCGCDLTKLVYV